MRQYEVFELTYNAVPPEKSLVNVDLTAEFCHEQICVRVKGFYAGNGNYKIRFCPEKTGEWAYKVFGIITDEGVFQCEKNLEGHGIVRAYGTHFKYSDGNWFYPFGTTVYALVHQEKDLVKQTMETLHNAPFNKVRICVFPKHYNYNENDPKRYAFTKDNDGKWNVEQPDFKFWDELEKCIFELDKMRIQCDLILFHPYDRWGFSKLTREQGVLYLDYMMRRLSAFPNIWWSLANEYDLMDYSDCDWEYFARFIHENDSFGHLLSNHHMVHPWDFSNKDTTHICLQINNVEQLSRWITKYQKPLMVDECCYEGNLPFKWGNISAFEMVNRFWLTCVQGGYCTHGETFLSDDDILWWSKGGVLKGESPKRIRFLREIVESLPGPLEYNGVDYTREMIEGMTKNPPDWLQNSFFKNLAFRVTWEEMEQMLADGRVFSGRCQNEAFLVYYGGHCAGVAEVELPEIYLYDVEVIDVWDMTRKVILSGVNGKIKICLPGKEGIAVLAKKTMAE